MKTYKSVYAQMVYSLILGCLVLSIPPCHEKWVSVFGLLELLLCFPYFYIARGRSVKAVLGTVYSRWFFTGIATLSALSGMVPWQIIPMKIFEAALAAWAWRETRVQRI